MPGILDPDRAMNVQTELTKAEGVRRMPMLRTYNVVPALPQPLERLRDIAYNLWWTWEPSAIELFIRLDRDLWEESGENPIRLMATISQERLEERAQEESYLAHLDRVASKLDHYLKNEGTWFGDTYGDLGDEPIAYFSMEFGLHTSIPIYSGGLGILSGDHLKAASDLGIPLVGVGLLYRESFRQYLNSDGWQQEEYPETIVHSLPALPVRDAAGKLVRVSIGLPGRRLHCRVWRVLVGRVQLLLLDSNDPENNPDDRMITARLYGGDQETRIQQEKILGIGGVRVLRALDFRPAACHLNEGHAAFQVIERIRWLMESHKVDFETARQAVMAGNCFTTHTPVPAGNDEFPTALVERYFADCVDDLGLSMDAFLDLGQVPHADVETPFSMPRLALRFSCMRNGVSKLHGEVSRKMWHHVWPDIPLQDVPIISITNAVHLRSWLSREFQELFHRYLGPKWLEAPDRTSVWERVKKIPNTELWRAHERRRERLVAIARKRMRQQLMRRGAPAREIARAEEVLDPEALTIGFARRFAPYKRATLLFRDPERLAKLLGNPDRPVQIIFAGKAHQRDDMGKELIRQVIHFKRDERFWNRIVFVEDYDMNLARYLVQGTDVWLNTPRRPLEASGTSGMKAVINGVLHLSVLDGWWAEGYQLGIGWAIGSGEEYADPEYQDNVECRALFDVLEEEVVPLFYERGQDGLPREWIARMKASIAELAPKFGMERMMKEYTEQFYVKAHRDFRKLVENDMARAAEVSKWLRRMRKDWPYIEVERVEADANGDLKVGADFGVRAVVKLGDIAPECVDVQVYYGHLDPSGAIVSGRVSPMAVQESASNGAYLFRGRIPCETSGQHAFSIRILPKHPDLSCVYETRLIRWA